jgi:hypothetical protein
MTWDHEMHMIVYRGSKTSSRGWYLWVKAWKKELVTPRFKSFPRIAFS